jgi:hypothetical protein
MQNITPVNPISLSHKCTHYHQYNSEEEYKNGNTVDAVHDSKVYICSRVLALPAEYIKVREYLLKKHTINFNSKLRTSSIT